MSFNDYVKSLPKKILSREEERTASKEQLIEHNIRFVVKFAHNYKNRGIEFEDLVSEGVLGLHRATENFDPNLGTKFITHARWYIMDNINKYISNNRTNIRIPVSYNYQKQILENEKREYYKKHGKKPTEDELIKFSSLKEKTIKRIEYSNISEMSIDNNFTQGTREGNGDLKLHEMLTLESKCLSDNPFKKIEYDELFKQIKIILDSHKNKKEINIFKESIFDKRKAVDIAKDYNISNPTVKNIVNRISKKIKQELGEL